MLGAPQTRLPGPGGPGWRSGADWPLGPGGGWAALRALAPVPNRRVRPKGVAAAVDPAPSAAGAAAAAWAGEPGPQSGGVLPGADQVVGGAVDVCPGGRGRADQQRLGARLASHGAVAQR